MNDTQLDSLKRSRLLALEAIQNVPRSMPYYKTLEQVADELESLIIQYSKK